MASGKDDVQYRAQAETICRQLIDLVVLGKRRDFRSLIPFRPKRKCGGVFGARQRQLPCNAKVGNFDGIITKQDVGGLEITMSNVVGMEISQSLRAHKNNKIQQHSCCVAPPTRK